MPDSPDVTYFGGLPGPKRMFLNDAEGCCTCATAGHLERAWTFYGVGKIADIEDSDIQDMYKRQGYVPGDASTDNGAAELDVLNDWRKNGCARRRIGAFAKVNPRIRPHVDSCVTFYRGLYVGVALPLTARQQDTWEVVKTSSGDADPGSWGPHAIPILGYNRNTGMMTTVTWGEEKELSRAFFEEYCDEAYALISADALTKGAPIAELDMVALLSDLKQITA